MRVRVCLYASQTLDSKGQLIVEGTGVVESAEIARLRKYAETHHPRSLHTHTHIHTHAYPLMSISISILSLI